jgi:hypothetical protein
MERTLHSDLDHIVRTKYPAKRAVSADMFYVVMDTCFLINSYRRLKARPLKQIQDLREESVIHVLPHEVLEELASMKDRRRSDEYGTLVPPNMMQQLRYLVDLDVVVKNRPVSGDMATKILGINRSSTNNNCRNFRIGYGDLGVIGGALELYDAKNPRSKVIIASDDSDISRLQKCMNPEENPRFYHMNSADYIDIIVDYLDR